MSHSWCGLFLNKKFRIPVIITFLLMFFQAFSGINILIFYSTSILGMAGLDNTSIIGTILVMLSNLLGKKFLLLIYFFAKSCERTNEPKASESAIPRG